MGCKGYVPPPANFFFGGGGVGGAPLPPPLFLRLCTEFSLGEKFSVILRNIIHSNGYIANRVVTIFRSVRLRTILLFYILVPVVRSIVSLTSSLRGQLVKCFMTL